MVIHAGTAKQSASPGMNVALKPPSAAATQFADGLFSGRARWLVNGLDRAAQAGAASLPDMARASPE